MSAPIEQQAPTKRWRAEYDSCIHCGKPTTIYTAVFYGADRDWGVGCTKCAVTIAAVNNANLNAARAKLLRYLGGIAQLCIESENRRWETEVGEALDELAADGAVIKSGEYYRINRVKFIVSPA